MSVPLVLSVEQARACLEGTHVEDTPAHEEAPDAETATGAGGETP